MRAVGLEGAHVLHEDELAPAGEHGGDHDGDHAHIDVYKRQVLDDTALETLHDTIQAIVYQSGDDFTTQYDRYMDARSGEAVANATTAFFIRYADAMIYCGVALVLSLIHI